MTTAVQTLPAANGSRPVPLDDEFVRLMAEKGYQPTYEAGNQLHWRRGNLRIKHKRTYVSWLLEGVLPPWVL